MSSIRITAVPPGFAPEYIREQWVGVTIPMPSAQELAEYPVSDMRIGSENLEGYLVFREKAIEALMEAGKKEAALFWDGLLLGKYLQFRKDGCVVVD